MKKFVVIIALLALVVSSGVFAEPTTQKVKITSLRPYASDNSGVYLQVDRVTPVCTHEGGINVFLIDLKTQKADYAAALTAFALDKEVQIEISNETGCTGWGTRIQSLYIHK
jgi:hypothetical protein